MPSATILIKVFVFFIYWGPVSVMSRRCDNYQEVTLQTFCFLPDTKTFLTSHWSEHSSEGNMWSVSSHNIKLC